MFKFHLFSSDSSEKNNNINEATPNTPEFSESIKQGNIVEKNASKTNEEKDKDFNVALSDLREAMSIQKEMGGNVSPETVFNIVGMKPEDLLAYLEGREINIESNELRDLMEPIKAAMDGLEEEYKDPSKLRKFANNKYTKAAFVAAMIFLKFAPNAKAANNEHTIKDKNIIKTEIGSEKKIVPDLDKTYNAAGHDFYSSLNAEKHNAETPSIVFEEGKNLSKIELTNYFVTDSDKIPENSQKIIQDQFKTFLDKITPENVGDILNSDFVIYGSSDERHTSNWGGSNENLTNARLNAIDNLLTKTLHDYHSDKLDANMLENIKAKIFSHKMPMHDDGRENGVTYITDLKNPDTGVNYTSNEVLSLKEHNIDKYNELLNSCRNINFSAKVEVHDQVKEIVPEPPHIEKTPFKPTLEKLSEYKNIVLLFDNSPSMGNSYKYIADAMHNQINDNSHNIMFGEFSDKLTDIEKFNNPEDIYAHINHMDHKGSSTENSFISAIKALNKVEVSGIGEKSIMFLMTDESFQDVSLDNIQHLHKLASEKNIDIKFMYGSDVKGEVREITLDDISKSYLKSIKYLYKGIYSTKTTTLETQIARMNNLYKQKTSALEKGLKSVTQEELDELKNTIESKTIELKNLKSDFEGSDVKNIFNNKTLKSFKFGGNNVDDKFTVTVMGENLGEVVK